MVEIVVLTDPFCSVNMVLSCRGMFVWSLCFCFGSSRTPSIKEHEGCSRPYNPSRNINVIYIYIYENHATNTQVNQGFHPTHLTNNYHVQI